MSERERAEALEECIMPILLGNTRLSHRISQSIYASCDIVSFIYGRMKLLDLLDISSQPLKLIQTDNGRLLCEALTDFCQKYPDMLPLIVPCSPKAEAFVASFWDELSRIGIIAKPECLIGKAPLEKLISKLNS